MKKRILTSLLALCVVLQLPLTIDMARANPESYSSKGSDYIHLTIIQPRNITYETSSIQITISVQANPGIWYVGYSLDDKPFIEIAPQKWLAHTFNETFSLNELSQGSHNLVAKANAPATPNEILTTCSNISFRISTRETSNPSISPTPTPIVPEFSWHIVSLLLLSISFTSIILRHRKNTKLNK